MICMAAAGRKKGLSERIGKIFAEIINIFTGSFWTECPEVDNGLKRTGKVQKGCGGVCRAVWA